MIKNNYEEIDKDKFYSLDFILDFLQKNSFAKFDESIDISINLNLDVRKSDQQIRGITNLPFGTGKKTIIAVFAKGEKALDAKENGADFVGSEDLVEKISSGFVDFNRCISTPDMMFLVSKLGKILGPKSLMPNPKLGTVTSNIKEAVKSAKSGQVEYRADKFGIIHASLGKKSFVKENLSENIKYFFKLINSLKPSGVKGVFVKSVFLSSTMSPGIRLLSSEI